MGRHLAISGVMGAGKSTLVRGLAAEFGCLALEERFEENPYLAAFYNDPPAWAFKSYVFFLQRTLDDYRRSRANGDGSVQERVLEEHLTVFGEEFHARGYLTDRDLVVLRSLTRTAAMLVPRPDLLIHVDVEPTEALARLRRRASPSERGIELDYLQALSRRYEELLAGWEGKLLRLDGTINDFREPACVARLATEIRDRLGPED